MVGCFFNRAVGGAEVATRFQMRKAILTSLLILGLLAAGCNGLPGLPASDRTQPDAGYYIPEPLQPSQTPFLPEPANSVMPVVTLTEEAQAADAEVGAGGSSAFLPFVSRTSYTLWVDPALPGALRKALNLPPDIGYSLFAGQDSLRLTVGEGLPLTRWVYVLAAPFPSLQEEVASVDLLQAWNGQPAGPFAGSLLLVDESTLAMFSALWGTPPPGAVQVLQSESLLQAAWEGRSSFAILPFEALEPRWKVLEVDGQSPLRKAFDPQSYPLTVTVSLAGDPDRLVEIEAAYGSASAAPLLPASNRDPGKLTVLAMTGVTAMVRATAYTMEQRGILYPGKDVGPWLREADITHISNEVPFAQNCPYPNPTQQGMRFCSDDRYIALLEDVGTDVVELTGDHFQDWGQQAMLHTLEMYRERGWGYYGGGENLQEGRQALIMEHNGNRLAFIGCNGKGGSFAQASAKRPGAVTCDFGWMEAEIAHLRAEGYLPVATFQHFEYYTYQAQPNQKRDFRALAHAGAVIVSGSQAHQPQALEFSDGALIHYGLGNLFFDQYDVSPATRQGFIDRHVFYDGRYIGSELLPIQFVDYARPRQMTPNERLDVLTKVFKASGW
ncbi:MAG: CapA family protein [Anaerolineales bacterium]